MTQFLTVSKHDTAVIDSRNFVILTLVRGSAREYRDEHEALGDEVEKTHTPLALGVIATIMGLLFLCASLIIDLVRPDGDAQHPLVDDPFLTGMNLGALTLILAGFAVIVGFGVRNSQAERSLGAMRDAREAKNFMLWFPATLAHRAGEIVLDAITVEVRDRLYGLLDEGEVEAVKSAVKMLEKRAKDQARREREDAESAHREAMEGLAREALGGRGGWL